MFDLNGPTSEEDTWRRIVCMVLTFWCRLGQLFRSWVCPGNLMLVRLTEVPRPILSFTAGFGHLKYASLYISSHGD